MKNCTKTLTGIIAAAAIAFGIPACDRGGDNNVPSAQTEKSEAKQTTAQARGYQIEYVSTDMAKGFYDQGTATFVDVRGDHAFEIEHITGALSYGLNDIKKGLLPDLPKDDMVVVYCGCPHSMSSEAAHIMQQRGFKNVYVLDEGYYDWKQKGYPIDMDEKYAATLKHMTIRGHVSGVAAGTPVYAGHEGTGQLEAGEVDADGNFELHLPFYEMQGGEDIVVFSDEKRVTIAFSEAGTDVELR